MTSIVYLSLNILSSSVSKYKSNVFRIHPLSKLVTIYEHKIGRYIISDKFIRFPNKNVAHLPLYTHVPQVSNQTFISYTKRLIKYEDVGELYGTDMGLYWVVHNKINIPYWKYFVGGRFCNILPKAIATDGLICVLYMQFG